MHSAFTTLTSKALLFPQTDIDTDQIIPARFLTVTDKSGLGKNVFYDWRYDDAGQPKPDFILNTIRPHDYQILLAGHNFGCGSSREHAPWALLDYGFRAVISTQIADIFKNNALKNGLLPVVVDEKTYGDMCQNIDKPITINLENNTLHYGAHHQVTFVVESFARFCLLKGVDQLGFILSHTDDITAYEQKRDNRV